MKIGIVGYGSMGQRHATNLRRLGHEVFIYDPAYPSGSSFKFERDLYDSDVEAVVISTPSMFHEGPLRAAIERGKHVLIEKPISLSVGALPQLLSAAEEKALVVMMGNNLRFHPAIQLAKTWMDEGNIGDVIWAHFTCAQKNGKYADSVVLNWGSHEVDVAMHLFGPAKVICSNVVFNAETATEDIADFVLQHDNGVRSSFHLDYLTPVEIRDAWIAGTRHNIGIDLAGRSISIGKHAQMLPGTFDNDYFDEVKAFVERIGSWIRPGATGWSGLEVLKVLQAVRGLA